MSTLWKAALPALCITAAATYAAHVRGVPSGELARGMPAIFALMCVYFALALSDVVRWLRRWGRDAAWKLIVGAQALLLPYLLYALPLGCFSPGGFLRLFLYVNLPLLILMASRHRNGFAVSDASALLLIWLPLDFHLLGPLWPWPPGQSGYFLFGILGVPLAVFLFAGVREMDEIRYTFAVRPRDLGVAAAGFVLFAPIAIGLGLITHFLRPAHHLPALAPTLARILGIFLVTGIPEELLFRGLLQNLVLRWTSRPALAVAVASVIFGLAHLNNGPHPDIRYFLLATLAGGTYGLVYRRTGTLLAPALTHTLVDATWVVFFHG